MRLSSQEEIRGPVQAQGSVAAGPHSSSRRSGSELPLAHRRDPPQFPLQRLLRVSPLMASKDLPPHPGGAHGQLPLPPTRQREIIRLQTQGGKSKLRHWEGQFSTQQESFRVRVRGMIVFKKRAQTSFLEADRASS